VNAAWVERRFANGFYPRLEAALFPVTHAFPWSLGDIAVLSGVAFLIWRLIVTLRARRWLIALIEILAVAGLYLFWFEAAWGWNYVRAPIEARVQYHEDAVNPRAVEALRKRAMSEINRLAPIAHATNQSLDLDALRDAWLPVVQAGGDAWTPEVGDPKPTIADPFMNATGTSGYINPFMLTSQLASDLLWFERPFDLAHEWSHVAAYAREDEANYLAILTCTRAKDPVLQYSGWLELFLYLPPKAKYKKSDFSPLVWSDFRALRDRNDRTINARLAQISWRTYNSYLKTNHVATGIENYNEVTRLYLGIPLDAGGLPLQSASTPLGNK
jgi:hypothetical protein